jgi:hypothetical protein
MKRGKAITGLIFVVGISLLFFSSYVGELKAASPITGKTPDKHQPDLMVEKVWLDAQCQINFLLKNTGKGSILDSEHSQGMVRVYFGKDQEDFYFTKTSPKGKPPVDPGGALKAPGGSVVYDTKIKLDSPLSVIVSVNEDKKITESKYENNKSTAKTLTPTCVSKADSPSKKPSGHGFPIGIERGISVSLVPSKGNYMPGETLTVQYRFRNPDIPDPLFVTIYLHLQGQGFDQRWKWSELWNIAAGRASIAGGEVSIPITITSGIEQGRPHVITVVKSSEIWGESDRFIIGTIPDSGSSGTGGREIEIVSPSAGDIWRRGGERLIKWRTPFPISPSISIMKGGRGVFFEPHRERVVYDPGSKTYVYRYLIPRDLEPGNDYKVRIVDSKNTSVHNESANFTITDQSLDLQVTDIRANTSGQLITTASVYGTFSGPVTFRVARVDWVVTDRSTRRGEYRPLETWEVPVASIRTGTREVNLGGARSTGAGCGEKYEVKIDSPDRIDEVNEDNNTLVKEVYFRSDNGTIEIKRGDHVLHHNDTISVRSRTSPTFSVWFKNCGTNRTRGHVEMRQIGRWETLRGGELSPHMRDHDILLGSRPLDLDSGATDYATMNERDPEAQDSRIEIRLTGEIARWAPANPIVIHVRRSE